MLMHNRMYMAYTYTIWHIHILYGIYIYCIYYMHSYHLSFSTLRPPLAFTDCKLLTDGAVVASDPCVVSCIAVVIGSPVITPTVVVVVGGLVVVGSGVSGISVWQVGRPTSPTSKPELTKNKLFLIKNKTIVMLIVCA